MMICPSCGNRCRSYRYETTEFGVSRGIRDDSGERGMGYWCDNCRIHWWAADVDYMIGGYPVHHHGGSELGSYHIDYSIFYYRVSNECRTITTDRGIGAPGMGNPQIVHADGPILQAYRPMSKRRFKRS